MRPVEFYTSPKGDVIIKAENELERVLTERDTEFIDTFLLTLSEFYTDAYTALLSIYDNGLPQARRYMNFLAVRRFIKCNFGLYDNQIDIDELSNFKFEFVGCPLRGECKYEGVICFPKFNSKLSDRQLQVMELAYKGSNDDEIAEKLFISLNTVNNHRKNSFRKLGLHSMKDFMRYAQRKNLFR